MTKRAGSTTVETNSNRVPNISHPAEVAKLIEQAAATSCAQLLNAIRRLRLW
ncbi:hypothetical protein [Paraburkholderia ultramafica]|uniref:hypothetical protein n=1 Tax=Paraburkholderia ultramafica TaxID=1544867 RepID=UPI001FEBE54F|nr:hypothetical protein [Paraburkholderia ultramafica]